MPAFGSSCRDTLFQHAPHSVPECAMCRRQKLLVTAQQLQKLAQRESGVDLALVGTQYNLLWASHYSMCLQCALYRRRKLLVTAHQLQELAQRESGVDLALVGTNYTLLLATLPTVLFLLLSYTSGDGIPAGRALRTAFNQGSKLSQNAQPGCCCECSRTYQHAPWP